MRPEVSPPELVGPQEEGELWIGGIGVAAGYLKRPDLTEQRFISDPFHSGGSIYKTGDLVRQREDGAYVFVRRMDDQVKINGFRIELAEIESVYSQHEAVDQAVAVVRNTKLTIYLKPTVGVILTKHVLGSIKELAMRSLTYYMIPR